MLLKDVELHWVKLDPNNPDKGFGGDKPNWCVNVRTRDKAKASEWKKANLNVKPHDDDNGIYYELKLSKPVKRKDGKDNTVPPVVGPDLMPFDQSRIGNGTIANVKVYQFEYEYNGKSGISNRLDAIQISQLVEYKREEKGNRWGFEMIDDEGIPAHAFTDGPKTGKNNSDEVY